MTDLEMTRGLRTYLCGGAYTLDLQRLYEIRSMTSSAIEQKEKEAFAVLCNDYLNSNDHIWYRTNHQKVCHKLMDPRLIGSSIEGKQLCRNQIIRRFSGFTLKYHGWHFNGERCERCLEKLDHSSTFSTF